MSWREGALVAPIVVAMLWIGLHPSPVLDRLRPTAEQVSQRLNEAPVADVAAAGRSAEAP